MSFRDSRVKLSDVMASDSSPGSHKTGSRQDAMNCSIAPRRSLTKFVVVVCVPWNNCVFTTQEFSTQTKVCAAPAESRRQPRLAAPLAQMYKLHGQASACAALVSLCD